MELGDFRLVEDAATVLEWAGAMVIAVGFANQHRDSAESSMNSGSYFRIRRRGEGHISLAKQRRLFITRWRSLIGELAAT